MIIGIDIGGTTTKLVGYADGEILHPLVVKADDPIASAAGALGKFLSETSHALADVHQIAITGVGAGRIAHSLLGLPVRHVGEFEAIGHGGTFLAGTSRAIVVSMGTGTAIVDVDADTIAHWGGTGVGGGTLVGLSKYLLGITDVFVLCQKAQQGQLNRIDLTIGDISSADIPGLAASLTASNFGKCADDAIDDDVALALVNLVFQTIGIVAQGAAKATGKTLVILTGRLTALPQAASMFADLSTVLGVTFSIPQNAEYATAVGAALVANATNGRRKKE